MALDVVAGILAVISAIVATSIVGSLLARYWRLRCAARRHACWMCIMCIAVVLAYSTRCLARSDSGDTAQVSLTEIDRNLGVVSSDEGLARATFEWVNKSSHELHVDHIAKSCHCEEVQYPRKISPGQKVQFIVTINLHSWRGAARVGCVVFFKEKERPPLYLSTEFFRPTPLETEPAAIDFGNLRLPIAKAATTRPFRFVWVGKTQEDSIGVEGNAITSRNGNVSCQLIGESKGAIRLPNSETGSLRQDFRFVARLKPDLPVGKLSDTILVPVVIHGEKSQLRVPVTGAIQPDIVASPSALVVPIRSGNSGPQEFRFVLTDYGGKVDSCAAESDDPRVKVTIETAKRGPEKSEFAVLKVSPPTLGASQRIDTTIHVKCKTSTGMSQCEIPVKFIGFTE